MVRSGSNLGKKFYGCSLWPVSGQNQTWVTNIGCLSIASLILFLFFSKDCRLRFFLDGQKMLGKPMSVSGKNWKGSC